MLRSAFQSGAGVCCVEVVVVGRLAERVVVHLLVKTVKHVVVFRVYVVLEELLLKFEEELGSDYTVASCLMLYAHALDLKFAKNYSEARSYFAQSPCRYRRVLQKTLDIVVVREVDFEFALEIGNVVGEFFAGGQLKEVGEVVVALEADPR